MAVTYLRTGSRNLKRVGFGIQLRNPTRKICTLLILRAPSYKRILWQNRGI